MSNVAVSLEKQSPDLRSQELGAREMLSTCRRWPHKLKHSFMTVGSIETVFRQQLREWLEENRRENAVRSIKRGSIALATAQNHRDENEDRVFYAEFHSTRADRAFALLAVLDGIGGLVDGGECAEMAMVSVLSKLLASRKPKQRVTLIEALVSANEDIRAAYRGKGGATFAGVFVQEKRVTSINVGDTRVYNFDSSRGGLRRLSSDDRLGDQVAKFKGLENITLEPGLAARLGRYLGMEDGLRPNVRLIESSTLRSPIGYLVIATDGAYGIGDSVIQRTLENYFEPRQIVEHLIREAGSDPDGDNATIVCAKANELASPVLRRGSVAFEELRLWTTEGSFNFVITQRIPADLRRTSARRSRSGPAKEDRQKMPAEGDGGTREKGKKQRVDSPKRELRIEQLSFEAENETTE